MASIRTLHLDIPAPDWDTPIGSEIIFDGWPLPSALRFLASKAGASASVLRLLPFYGYGPWTIEDAKGLDVPVLGRGTGLAPLYRYGAHLTIGTIFASLISHQEGDAKYRLSR